MKRLITILAISLLSFSCATTSITPSGSPNLQGFIEKLSTLSKQSIETKRIAAIAILEHVVFDIGFWEVILETSSYRPDPNTSKALSEIIRLARKRDELPEGEELSDYELSRTLGWSLVLMRGLIKYATQETIPQITQLLGLF